MLHLTFQMSSGESAHQNCGPSEGQETRLPVDGLGSDDASILLSSGGSSGSLGHMSIRLDTVGGIGAPPLLPGLEWILIPASLRGEGIWCCPPSRTGPR